jgi:hypothetical protein
MNRRRRMLARTALGLLVAGALVHAGPAAAVRDGPAETAAVDGADPCVHVLLRSSQMDGREVVSVDLHGDGLIKAALPDQLAGDFLAPAAMAALRAGARAECVPPALAQAVFHHAVNVAELDSAVTMAQVGERWVLAGSRNSESVARIEPPLRLALATTLRGARAEPKATHPH